MRALEFTCNFRDVVMVAMHSGYTQREYSLPAQLRTDGNFAMMKVVVSFGGDPAEADKALQYLKILTDKERIGSCYITV
jgi:hypothetical protein